jgi:hypothetical protein
VVVEIQGSCLFVDAFLCHYLVLMRGEYIQISAPDSRPPGSKDRSWTGYTSFCSVLKIWNPWKTVDRTAVTVFISSDNLRS